MSDLLSFAGDHGALSEALAIAARATRQSSTLPILQCIHFLVDGDELTLTGSSLDQTTQVRLAVGQTVKGRAALPAKLIADTVKHMEGAVKFQGVDEDVVVTGGRARFTLRCLPVDEFPRVDPPSGTTVVVESNVLANAIRKVAVAAASTDDAPVLSGVLLQPTDGGVRLAATDRYRLAVLDLPGLGALSSDGPMIVPRSALTELGRLLPPKPCEVTVSINPRRVFFQVGATTFSTKLIEGEFPPFEKLLPATTASQLTVEREPLIAAIQRVKVMARDNTTPVQFSLLSGEDVRLRVVSNEVGSGDDMVPGVYDGQTMKIGFNPDFLLAGLQAMSADEVVFEMNDPSKPAVVHGLDQPDYRYLVMPVRLNA